MFSITLATLLTGQTIVATAPLPASEKPKVICREIKVTGSRLARRRVCGTARQWEVADAEAQEAAREYQDQSTGARSMNEPTPSRGPG